MSTLLALLFQSFMNSICNNRFIYAALTP
jgi:hypothetical protein